MMRRNPQKPEKNKERGKQWYNEWSTWMGKIQWLGAREQRTKDMLQNTVGETLTLRCLLSLDL